MRYQLKAFELDLPRCSRTYGVAPCTAQLGDSNPVWIDEDDWVDEEVFLGGNSEKCFNCAASCQDPANYDEEIQVVRFSGNENYYPIELDALPYITGIETQPQKIRPGINLGTRERATISFTNATHNDVGFDNYLTERDYNPSEMGTFAGKFFARYPNLAGYSCRILRDNNFTPYGTPNFEVSHYFIDSANLSGDLSGFSIEVVDAIKFIDGSKTLYPLPSNGITLTDIPESGAFSVVIEPSGVGAEYPSTGEAAMGKEIVEYSISGDTVSVLLAGRGIRSSAIEAHDTGTTFQIAPFVQGNFAFVLNELLENTNTPSGYLNYSVWNAEAAAYAPAILQSSIPKPTAVKDLVNDLMADVGLDIHTDIKNQKIIAEVLRSKLPTFHIDPDLAKNPRPNFDYTRRISAAYIQYGIKNPLENKDEAQNYVGHLYRVDDSEIHAIQNNIPQLYQHKSRWIPETNRQLASTTAQIVIGSNSDVKRNVSASIPTIYAPSIGDVGTIQSRVFSTFTGAMNTIQVQVERRKDNDGMTALDLSEFTANAIQVENNRDVNIDADRKNINMWDIYVDTWGDGPVPKDTEIFIKIADGGIYVGSSSPTNYAIESGIWPVGVVPTLVVGADSVVIGHGGYGGVGGNGGIGGSAILVTSPIKIDNNSRIGGGGGGGAGARLAISPYTVYTGGGGAGFDVGGGNPNGTRIVGGDANPGGDGGGVGAFGFSGSGGPVTHYSGGAPGKAIQGVSLVTFINTGVIQGVQDG